MCVCWVSLDMFDNVLSVSKSRWNAVCVFGNSVISLFSADGAYKALMNPLHCTDVNTYADGLFGPSSKIPIWMMMIMHVYHLFTFDNIPRRTFNSHSVILGVGLCGLYYEWGALRNCVLFFTYGVPELIENAMGLMIRNGMIEHQKRSQIACKVNTWIRNPMMSMCMCMHLFSYIYGWTTIPNYVHLTLLTVMYYTNSLMNENIIRRNYA